MPRLFSAIHQFHSGASFGDAITNQMFALQVELRGMGYKSDIYAEHFDRELATSIRHIDSLIPSPEELILIHHSMGHRRLDQILEFPNPLVTVYHNITPAQELFDVSYKHFSHIGRHQLDVLAKQSLLGIADSHYNRKEMLLRGFKHVEVIPVRTDFQEFQSAREKRNPERDWLFVGRFAPNKKQIEIIRAFNHYHHHFDKSTRLFLIGDHQMRSYVDVVGDEIEKLGLKRHIDAPGKIEDVDLVHRYARAGVFVSLSQHEGFGVPLLEAMATGVPVVALESSAVTETMGGAGVLISSLEPEVVSNAVHQLMVDSAYREEIIWKQDRRIEKISRFNTRNALSRVLDHLSGFVGPTRIQIQGPIESSYSLAVLNRETSMQLQNRKDFEVSVFPTEGPGDYPPNMERLNADERLSAMYNKGLSTPYPDVIIRQMFPPRVKDTTAPVTIQYFGWEESVIPARYISEFNAHVDRIMAMSTFVKDSLVQSGVTVPIDVVGVGVRRPFSEEVNELPEIESFKRIKFLHISSAFPRKGVDILLKAYFTEFTGDDDVTLIIKTIKNPHSTVVDDLRNLSSSHPNPPHVVLIDRDVVSSDLGKLYELASAYVHCARGEGFGLPVAEAMLAGVPVISTATSGLSDFVDLSTAAVIPSFLSEASSHVSENGSQWFEPSLEGLQQELRKLYSNDEESIRIKRLENAKTRIESQFSWDAVGNRIKESIDTAIKEKSTIRITHVSTFNSHCGIAEYSSLLLDGLPKSILSTVIADKDSRPIQLDVEEDVLRLWTQARRQDVLPLATAIHLSNADIVHLQYNFGFFSLNDLTELFHHLEGKKPIVITLHRTKDLDRGDEVVSLAQAAEALRGVDAVIVHEEHDLLRLAQYGISNNVHLIPHGAMPFRGTRSARTFSLGKELRLGTFGFLLPHKGLEVSLKVVRLLNQQGIETSLKALCSLHPDSTSMAAYESVRKLIDDYKLNSLVNLDTSFKSIEEIHSELSDVDILVIPYSQTEESSSGVLAMLLGVGKPIVATDLDIFSGARDALTLIPSPARAEDLKKAIEGLISNPIHLQEMGKRAAQRSIDISWGVIGRQTNNLYRSLLNQPQIN